MREAFFLLLCVMTCGNTVGQFKNNDWYISPKISFADYSDRNSWEGYSITKIPPISVAVERGITDYFSVGTVLGFNRDKFVNDTLPGNAYRYSDFAVGALANVHFAGWIEKWSNYSIYLGDWDLYAGVSLMLRWKSSKETDVWNSELQILEQNRKSSFNMKVRPLVGVRYFVSDNFCMLVEVGHGNMGLVTTGITFRIPQHNY